MTFAIDRSAPSLDRTAALHRAVAEHAPSTCEQCGTAGVIGGDLMVSYLYAGSVDNPIICCVNLAQCWARKDRRGGHELHSAAS